MPKARKQLSVATDQPNLAHKKSFTVSTEKFESKAFSITRDGMQGPAGSLDGIENLVSSLDDSKEL